MAFQVTALPPFSISINDRIYTDERTKDFPEDQRLPADILATVVNNIINFASKREIGLSNEGDNVFLLYVDDDNLYAQYNIELYYLGNVDTTEK